jgi:hypothetical protein
LYFMWIFYKLYFYNLSTKNFDSWTRMALAQNILIQD